MRAPSKQQHVPVRTHLQGHALFLPRAGSVLSPRQMYLAHVHGAANIIHTDPLNHHGLHLQLGSYPALANPDLTGQPAWRGSSVVTTSLSKAPISQPRTPRSKSTRPTAPSTRTAGPGQSLCPRCPPVSPSPEGVRLLPPSLGVKEPTCVCRACFGFLGNFNLY